MKLTQIGWKTSGDLIDCCFLEKGNDLLAWLDLACQGCCPTPCWPGFPRASSL